MKVSPFEREPTPPRPADRPDAPRKDPAAGAEVRASPDGGDPDDPRRDEMLDEPGYGHGV